MYCLGPCPHAQFYREWYDYTSVSWSTFIWPGNVCLLRCFILWLIIVRLFHGFLFSPALWGSWSCAYPWLFGPLQTAAPIQPCPCLCKLLLPEPGHSRASQILLLIPFCLSAVGTPLPRAISWRILLTPETLGHWVHEIFLAWWGSNHTLLSI